MLPIVKGFALENNAISFIRLRCHSDLPFCELDGA